MWTVRRFWQALVALALVGCIASLFGPGDRWWGVDIGATGASLFHLALIGAVILASMRPREIFPEDWAIAERRGWVGLVFTAMILAGFCRYLVALSDLEQVPMTIHELPWRRMQVLLVMLFIAWGVISGVLSYAAGAIEADERDLRMRHAADRAGDWALTAIVIGGVVLLVNAWRLELDWWLEPLILANVLVGVLIAKSLFEQLALVTLYARARR